MKVILELFRKKLLEENAPLILLIGICPLLMASKTLLSGLVMATAVGFVLIFSSATVSLLRKLIPDNVRIVAYMLIIATFVAISELLIRSYLPTHYANLGIYIPVIASAGIVFAHADNVASKNGAQVTVVDGILTALAFATVIAVVSLIREFFGSGTIFSQRIIAEEYAMSFALSPAGGLMLIGFIAAILKRINLLHSEKKEEKK